jgi:hypothetical protein
MGAGPSEDVADIPLTGIGDVSSEIDFEPGSDDAGSVLGGDKVLH